MVTRAVSFDPIQFCPGRCETTEEEDGCLNTMQFSLGIYSKNPRGLERADGLSRAAYIQMENEGSEYLQAVMMNQDQSSWFNFPEFHNFQDLYMFTWGGAPEDWSLILARRKKAMPKLI